MDSQGKKTQDRDQDIVRMLVSERVLMLENSFAWEFYFILKLNTR